jgi:replicative DNA helicase
MIDTLGETGSETTDLKRSRPRKTASADTFRADRLPPNAPEAEQGVLGCILLSPNECVGECIEKLKDDKKAQVFYDLRHQTIFSTLVEMYDRREAIDLITLSQRLKDKQLLDQVGGLTFLASLPDSVPSAANLSYYFDIVQEKYVLRKIIQTCTSVVGRVYDYEGEVDSLMDEVERDILRISESRVQTQSTGIKELVHRAINTIELYHQRQGQLTGLSTGFTEFDRMTNGLHEGEMVVIAARPSMGKTSLAMNIAEHVAIDLRLPVGVFSLEMTADSLVLRLLCSRAKVNLKDIRSGFLVERDFPKITNAAGQLAAAPLYIDDTSGLSILQLRAKARRMAQQHGVKLFVIDYLQQMNSTSRKVDNRQQEIADISNGVKALAKELRVPVIVLSQLNRDFEKDKTRKPNLADLRESGAIEQDADLVGILYKVDPEDSNKRKDDVMDEETGLVPDSLAVNLLIAKQRNGPTGDVPLTFFRTYTRFEDRSKIDDSAVPAGH